MYFLVLVALLCAPLGSEAGAQTSAPPAFKLPTGMSITPEAARGAWFRPLRTDLADLPDNLADEAVAVALSPDRTALLILTSGSNRRNTPDGKRAAALSSEYIFVFDVSGPTPVQRQILHLPNSFWGLAWAPDGQRFYASGGVDDVVMAFRWSEGRFVEEAKFPLGHTSGNGIAVKPAVAGLAISPDGTRLLVANYENDSVTLLALPEGRILAERDLRPGKIDRADAGRPGGSYPWGVAWSSNTRAYVSIQRDREILALDVGASGVTVKARIATRGQPNHLLASSDGTRLYAALDNSDSVLALDTATNRVLADIPATAPAEILPNQTGLRGANPNFLAFSPDQRTLFVTLGGLNAVSVLQLDQDVLPLAKPAQPADDDDDALAPTRSRVIGLIPTGWYPNAVAFAGERLYVVNGKSPPGPNPGACRSPKPCEGTNQYILQLEHAGFLALPMPSPAELARLTRIVARNDNFPGLVTPATIERDRVMAELRTKIRHVIYIIKENRTYDQVLGDLEVGNGDPSLALFPEAIGPNHHALARNFVTLDNFYDAGAVSPTGWNWSTAARSTDMTEKTVPVTYAGRGFSYDWEGSNRNINISLPSVAERRARDPRVPEDPDLLAGTADVAAPDAAGGEPGAGYLWDLALRAHLTIRNYGFFGDFVMNATPLERDPHASGLVVFRATKPGLEAHSDPYYRGFDMRYPDFWRVREWQREFTQADAAGTVPNLTLLRLPHDHLGFAKGMIDKVDTAETQFADNDYALGLIVETVAKSAVADSTLIFVLEDDAQNGPDHVDAHRSAGFVIGPYVKQRAVVSRHYTTVSMLRTIEEVLGLPPMGLNDGLAEPMTEVFDLQQATWRYRAIVPEVLRRTDLPLPAREAALNGPALCRNDRLRDAAWYAAATMGQDVSKEDRLDVDAFNRAIWTGRMGWWASYPERDGVDRTPDRGRLMAAWRARHGCPKVDLSGR
jgi:YVTN family beta-propeller protein